MAPKGLLLAAGIVLAALGSAGCAAYQSLRYPCLSKAKGIRGEVMRGPDGQFLYYNAECWTTRAMPPRDMPLVPCR